MATEEASYEVGKVLLEVQDEIRELRRALSLKIALGESSSTFDYQKVEEALTRAENNIRAKAETVLHQSVSKATTSELPATSLWKQPEAQGEVATILSDIKKGESEDKEGEQESRKQKLRRTVKQQREEERLQALQDPIVAAGDRRTLSKQFGVATGTQASSSKEANGRVALPRATGRYGLSNRIPSASKLGKTGRAPRVGKAADGHIEPFSDKDVEKGLLDLINRGLLPPHVDLTPAFITKRPPVLCGPVNMYPFEQQFVKQETAVGGVGGTVALPSLKLDLMTLPEKPLSKTGPVKAPSTLKKATPSGTASMHKVTVGQETFPAREKQRDRRHTEDESNDDALLGIRSIKPEPAPSEGRKGSANKDRSTEGKLEPLPEIGGMDKQKADVDDPRTYFDMLDEYSLHHFIIRKGRTLTTTPEFLSYERSFSYLFPKIKRLIRRMEKFLGRYAVPIAYIDGKRLAKFAIDDLSRPSFEDLLTCVVNMDSVGKYLHIPGRQFLGGEVRDIRGFASVMIQAWWRGVSFRRGFHEQLLREKAAIIIQRWMKGRLQRCRFLRARDARRRATASSFADLQASLKKQWNSLGSERRVIVHVPSLGFQQDIRESLSDFLVRENEQIPRICSLLDPNVDVVYVCPYPLSEDVKNYFKKLLKIGGVDTLSDLVFVVPEWRERLPMDLPLSSLLYYCPRAMKTVKAFLHGRPSYLVSGLASREEVNLAVALGTPLLGVDGQRAAILGSKSGARDIFEAAEVNVTTGVSGINDLESLTTCLARVIIDNPDVERWLVKLDAEFCGRGHAIIETKFIRLLLVARGRCMLLTFHHNSAIKNIRGDLDSSVTHFLDPAVKEKHMNKIRSELSRSLPRRLVLCSPHAYRSFDDFCRGLRCGAVIEAFPEAVASPSTNIFVDPFGEVLVLSTHDQILVPGSFNYAGSIFPQRSVSPVALHDAAVAIGKAAAAKGFLGYAGIDFILVADKARRAHRLFAVDFNPMLTSSQITFAFFHFVTGGEWNAREGTYRTEATELGLEATSATRPSTAASTATEASEVTTNQEASEEDDLSLRYFVAHNRLFHPNLRTVQYAVFFNLCRLRGLHFDLQERKGVVFNILDSFAGGTIGALCVGRTREEGLQLMKDTLDFLSSQLGAPQMAGSGGEAPDSNFAYFSVAVKKLLINEKKSNRLNQKSASVSKGR